jgi:hypothetical protein
LTSRFWPRGISDFTRKQREGDVSKRQLSTRIQYRDFESCLPLLIPDVCKTRQPRLTSRCYLVTHAHLDHTLSLIMLSGSVPPRPTIAKHPQPPIPPNIPLDLTLPPKGKGKAKNEAKAVGLWPELGHWASWRVTERKEDEGKTRSRKRKAAVLVEKVEPSTSACGVALTP